ncbi:hypothetical protein [Teredinibacter franksiae]|uniref:hypothetical protein n=1 Tax=Teredinibacter franksiae TaxID=2761453 RepID=UPI00162A69F1|nr:hypothetical protein [Teredinibacter franksiae]
MKKWLVTLSISFFFSCFGLGFFVITTAQSSCLESGGSWQSILQGCSDGQGYSLQYLATPLAITIFAAIVVAISSAVVQLRSIIANNSSP